MYVNKGVFKRIDLVISQVCRQVRAGFSLLPVGIWSRAALASGEKNTDSFDLTACRVRHSNLNFQIGTGIDVYLLSFSRTVGC